MATTPQSKTASSKTTASTSSKSTLPDLFKKVPNTTAPVYPPTSVPLPTKATPTASTETKKAFNAVASKPQSALSIGSDLNVQKNVVNPYLNAIDKNNYLSNKTNPDTNTAMTRQEYSKSKMPEQAASGYSATVSAAKDLARLATTAPFSKVSPDPNANTFKGMLAKPQTTAPSSTSAQQQQRDIKLVADKNGATGKPSADVVKKDTAGKTVSKGLGTRGTSTATGGADYKLNTQAVDYSNQPPTSTKSKANVPTSKNKKTSITMPDGSVVDGYIGSDGLSYTMDGKRPPTGAQVQAGGKMYQMQADGTGKEVVTPSTGGANVPQVDATKKKDDDKPEESVLDMDTSTNTNTNGQPSDQQMYLNAYNQNAKEQMDALDAQADTERVDQSNQNFLKNLDTVRNFARRGSLDSGMYQNALAQQAFANASALDKINARTDANKLKLGSNLLNNQFRNYTNLQQLQAKQDMANNKLESNERIASEKLTQQVGNQLRNAQSKIFSELGKNYDVSSLAPAFSAYLTGGMTTEQWTDALNQFYKTRQVTPQDRATIEKNLALADQAVQTAEYKDAQTGQIYDDKDGYQHYNNGEVVRDARGNPVMTFEKAWKEADLGIKSRLADARQQTVINQGRKMANDEGYRAANISVKLQDLIRKNSVNVNQAANVPLNAQLKFINSRIYTIGQSIQNGTPTPEQQKELADLAGAGVAVINDMKKNAQATTNVLNTQTTNLKGQ